MIRRNIMVCVTTAVVAWSATAAAQPQRERQRQREHQVEPVRGRRPGVVARPTVTVRRPEVRSPAFERRMRFRERAVVSNFGPRQGPPGTEVTIRGRGLDRDVALSFGGRELRPRRVTPTAVTFVVPPQSTSGPILFRPRGAPDVVVGMFEVTPQPPPRMRRDERRAMRRAEAERRWRERQATLAATEAARWEALRREEERLRQTREERRRRRVLELHGRFDRAFLAQPAVMDELALHAERIARLDRMQRLADVEKNTRLAVRVQVLRAEEEERHQARMADLRALYRPVRRGIR
jgi:hypothetical protein